MRRSNRASLRRVQKGRWRWGRTACRSCLHLSHQGTIVEAAGVRRIVTLKLELIDDRDIVVSHPESGFSVTYRKTGNEPMLIAIDGIDRVTDGSKAKFLAQAWKAAYQKAQELGWLNS